MQAVPPGSPKRAFAEKKVVEYMRNLIYSQQQAGTTRQASASFSSDLLNEQLELYLSYVATVGPPDVLIVGSSRALQGVDPKQLEQSLAANGRSGLTIFNFAVNGATAQVVDFQLRRLLKPQQLPQMIVWADGVRAFNSGRADRTFNSIIASEGNQLLVAGVRPKLPEDEPNVTPQCYKFPQPCRGSFQRVQLSKDSEDLAGGPDAHPTSKFNSCRCLFLKLVRAGQMPTPQANSTLVEQASCLFLTLVRAGQMPTPQANSTLVEQASCLFLTLVERVF